MSVDYMYYETPGTQQPSLQYQISCCLVSHPSNEPPYDWKDATVSTKFTCFWKNAVEDFGFFFFNFGVDLAADMASGDAQCLPGSHGAKRVASFLLSFPATEEQQRY